MSGTIAEKTVSLAKHFLFTVAVGIVLVTPVQAYAENMESSVSNYGMKSEEIPVSEVINEIRNKEILIEKMNGLLSDSEIKIYDFDDESLANMTPSHLRELSRIYDESLMKLRCSEELLKNRSQSLVEQESSSLNDVHSDEKFMDIYNSKTILIGDEIFNLEDFSLINADVAEFGNISYLANHHFSSDNVLTGENYTNMGYNCVIPFMDSSVFYNLYTDGLITMKDEEACIDKEKLLLVGKSINDWDLLAYDHSANVLVKQNGDFSK